MWYNFVCVDLKNEFRGRGYEVTSYTIERIQGLIHILLFTVGKSDSLATIIQDDERAIIAFEDIPTR